MFRFVILGMLVAVAHAGLIGDYGHGGLIAAPVLHAAPSYVHAAPIAVKAHVATSYANSNSIALHPHAVVTAAHAPVVHAAPVVVGHGLGLGGLGGYGHGGIALGHGGYGYGH